MNSRNFAVRGAMMGALIGSLFGAGAGLAQTMDQYYAVPPFVDNLIAPNIILMLDNSGSMSDLACDRTDDGDCLDQGASPTPDLTFTSGTQYAGYFDSLTCYLYDTTDARFEPNTTKATLATACGNTEWDGNFLNFATFRRFDALKKAMSGGDCFSTRNADGTCPATGTPALKTVVAQGNGVATQSARSNTYAGRVPSSTYSNTTGTFFVRSSAGTPPYFNIAWSNSVSTTSPSYGATQYILKIGYSLEPTGVIQQIGAQARFGLFEFKPDGTGNGARMLVGVGSRQSINFADNGVETFNTNMAAMLDALGESFPSTWTPLSESLYEMSRYVAQVNSSYQNSAYVYPIAFSGGNSNGVAFQATGVGSIGAPEITALTGTEVCPAGYITNACGRDPYFYGSNHTPAWASTSTVVPCCKTFVILVTDGEPTQDTAIPSGLQDYGHGHHGVHCTGSDTSSPTAPINTTCNSNINTTAPYLIGTDPSTTATSGEHKTDYADSGNHYLDDVAYWAHTNDLRPCNGTADGTIAVINITGKCLQGLQNITLYTFFAFGNIHGRELLMRAATLGGFEDRNGNNIPDQVSEWDQVINATGKPGTDGIPDNYFESSNVDDLQDRLMATLTAILRKSASGTSISVLATSATGEGTVYQAYFFTNDVGQNGANVKWLGYTHALFIDAFGNFREDTVQDGVLDYKQDLIVTTRFDNNPASPTYQKVLVDKFNDLDGNGIADSATPVITQDLKSIKPIWEAGQKLALRDPNTRKVLTWVDQDNDGLVDSGEQMDFSTANCTTLRDYLRYAGDACGGGTNATNLINFIRGTEVPGLRTRMMEVPIGSGSYNVWKLGDPIHSTPTVVGAPKSRYDLVYGDGTYTAFYQKYRTRRQVVYVGANDGMLHAFNGGYYHKGDDPTTTSIVEHGWYTKNPTDNSSGMALGEELWSYVPYQLLPQLQWLARTDYTHVYYVDLKPTIAEARIFTPDADHPGGWGTILIGGFRMGGSCGSCMAGAGAPPMTATIGGVTRTFYSAYFVLDVTNPEVDPKLLWSFGSGGLGLTTSYPAVARMNPTTDASTDPTNEKWYVIFGSGPNGYNADLPTPPSPAAAQTAKLYVIDLKAGPGAAFANVTRMPIGSWNAFMGHVVAVDKNLDWRTDVAYAGRVINDGALPWRGKMYRLTMSCAANPCSPTTWGVASGTDRSPTEIIDTYYDAPSGANLEVGPIAAAPTVTVDDANKLWVFFGTGRYFSNADKIDNSLQGLYGIKDVVLNGTCTETTDVTSCGNGKPGGVQLVDVTKAVICLVCSGGTNQVTDPTNPGVTTFNGTGTNSMVGLVQSKDGWRITLSGPATLGGVQYSAERSVVNPTLIAGTVFFATFTPANDFCASDGQSYLYALFYKTGTAATTPVIGTTASGSNTNVTTRISLGVGLASSGTMSLGEQGKINFQQSTGAFTQTNTSLTNEFSRFVSWVHQRD